MRRPCLISVRSAFLALALAIPACSPATTGSDSPATAPPPVMLTICGPVVSTEERARDGEIATLLTIEDARSGSRFVFEIAPEKRAAFEAALGAPPAIAYRDASVCATGLHPEPSERPLLILASPSDVTINSSAR